MHKGPSINNATAYKTTDIVLSGDIGGTKTNLALFSRGKTRPVLKFFQTYPSRKYLSLEKIIEEFLPVNPRSLAMACLGIAGPVMDGKVKTTNLPWEISETRIMEKFGFGKAKLINDLTATALSVPLLKHKDTVYLNRVRASKNGNIVVLAPGTGTGVAFLFNDNGRYEALPSEGGHADLASLTQNQDDLIRYLRNRYGRVSMERVISGNGLINIYDWLKETGRFREPEALKELLENGDPAEIISKNAIDNRYAICTEALREFVSILGAAAGNLALTVMALGGVYLGGGIPPKIIPALSQGAFMESFEYKGRFSGLMKKIPVRIIVNNRAALYGAACRALELTGS